MGKLHDLREHYDRGYLLESDMDPDPFRQFANWFTDALEVVKEDANAMAISTVNESGAPSSRMVLLKEMDDRGFVYYTNYASRKGIEIAANPHVSLLFWWAPLQRQIRIEGQVEKVDRATTQAYFDTRPFGSRLGAIASPQSQRIESREILEQIFNEAEEKYSHLSHPEAPETWGGYRVVPTYFEFWQGRLNRLHDRMSYMEEDGKWKVYRLAP